MVSVRFSNTYLLLKNKKMEKIKIKDLYGEIIIIDNLDKAVQQADEFRKYKQVGKKYASFNKERKAYWEDVYKKLITKSFLFP